MLLQAALERVAALEELERLASLAEERNRLSTVVDSNTAAHTNPHGRVLPTLLVVLYL